ncbi:MAG: hypothetical protein GXP59_03410, partial [Deltaproteobacteria bacterium]|nr:hypothetical protein [Deltaproteobacteria bacterium]
RLYLTRLIILLLALSGMIFIHFHYVVPQLRTKLAEPVTNAEAPQDQTAAAGNRLALVEFYNSLQRMKKSVPDNSKRLAKAEVRKQRNPFFWPTKVNSPYISSSAIGVAQSASHMSRSGAAASSTRPRPLPVLRMTIVGEHRQIALIQDQFRTVGERINSDMIKGIGNNFVILTRATGRDVKVMVAQNSGYGVAVEPTGGGSFYSPPPAQKSSQPQPGAASFMSQQNKLLLQLMQQLKQSR